MRVRAATEADLARVFEMGVDFIVSNPTYATVLLWTPEGLENFVRFLALEATNTILVLEEGDALIGMLALALIPNLFGGPPWVEEIAYWLDPPHRRGRRAVQLLAAAEDWARGTGASVLKMVSPWGSQIGTLYERRSYEPFEITYILRL